MTKSHKRATLLAVATLGLSASGLSAATLAYYDIPSGTSAGTVTSISLIDSASDITSSGGFELSTSSGTAFSRHSNTDDTLALAKSTNDYLQMDLTIGATAVDFTAFQFTSGVNSTEHPSGSGHEAYITVEYSLDGFATAGTTVDTFTRTAGGTFNLDYDLSGFADLQSLTGSTVSFRMYAYDTDGTSGHINRVQNITITGVPEPSSALLSLLGASALFLRRRR